MKRLVRVVVSYTKHVKVSPTLERATRIMTKMTSANHLCTGQLKRKGIHADGVLFLFIGAICKITIMLALWGHHHESSTL
jgi:hypothetical protein